MSGSHLMNFVGPVHLVHGSVDLVHAFFLRKIIPKTIKNPWGAVIL
jgi:hypothetical protein